LSNRMSEQKSSDLTAQIKPVKVEAPIILNKDVDIFAVAKASLQDGLKEKVAKLLEEGKRAIISEDFHGSLKPLGECCHVIATNFGEMNDMLAEPAYLYGSSLLEVSRVTQNIFGTEVGEKNEKNDDVKENGDANKLDSISEKKAVEEKEEENDEEEEDAEDDDAQMAYEWLEIARVLYNKRENNKEAKLKEASCLSQLAELKTENDQLEDARTDYDAALVLFKEYLDKNDRKIATIYYQRGSVELFLQMPGEARVSFENALKIVRENISQKKADIAADTDGKIVGKLLADVKSLLLLVPELEEKIAEASTGVAEIEEMKNALKNVFGLGGNSTGFGKAPPKTGGQPVVVNTLQVKRKAKTNDQHPSKKSKPQ